MRKSKLKRVTPESGLTLVEVLASIVILTLLITTFLTFFLQSAKVNKTSEHIIDATYSAQTAMENIYELTLRTKYYERENAIEEAVKNLGYVQEDTDPSIVFEGIHSDTGERIKIRLKTTGNENMDHIIIEVYEGSDENPQAKMQNMLVWRTN